MYSPNTYRKRRTRSLLSMVLSALLIAVLACGTEPPNQGSPPIQTAAPALETQVAGIPPFENHYALGVVANGNEWIPQEKEGDLIIEMAEAGANFYIFPVDWRIVEPSPGDYDLDLFEFGIPWTKNLGYKTMLTIPTINTVARSIPADINHLPFDDPVVLRRFDQLLEELKPILESDVDYISLGNEVDIYLALNPEEIEPFARFAAHGYETLERLGINKPHCVTFTVDGLLAKHQFIDQLIAECDYLPITYYPLGAGSQFRDPDVAESDIGEVVRISDNLPIVFQELGYGTGGLSGGSEARQAAFYENALRVMENYANQIEAVSITMLHDFSRATCEEFSVYYGFPEDEAFEDFLCYLGLKYRDGTPKEAYPVFLAAIDARK